MSLRTDVHNAFDVIAPPTGGMAERVVETARRQARIHERRRRFMVRVHAPMSLVAVFIVIVLVAAALMGGQLIRVWNTNSTVPAGNTFQSQVAQLEARALHLPAFKSQAECTSGPYNAVGDLGSGPMYTLNYGRWSSDWGVYYDNVVYSDSRIAGPIVVRARDLFTTAQVFFVGQFSAGPVASTEVIDGSNWYHRPELVLTTSTTSITPSTHKYHWEYIAAIPKSWSGSSGWQIDAAGFSEVFVAC